MLQKTLRYYKYLKRTGLFAFLYSYGAKLLLFLLAFFGLISFLNIFFPIERFFEYITLQISVWQVYLFFYASESFLGIISPDLFIFWIGQISQKLSINAWYLVLLLSLTSYFGGLTAWGIGAKCSRFSFFKNLILRKYRRLFLNFKKWGGFFILVSALLPVPFSVVMLLCGLVKYPFKWVIFWASFRPIRFCFDAFFIFYFFG